MNYTYLQTRIFETLGFKYDTPIDFIPFDGMFASLHNGKAVIGANTEAACCRALTEFALRVSKGLTDFEVSKSQHFTWCGPMLDMSRNGVLRVESVKKYLDLMACFGMNMIMLYCEDTFEMEKYQFFGYKRGRYTIDEMREIDDYAYALGIEVIPCVQTLGHLDKYLPWAEADPIRDNNFNLYPGSEASLEFIEEVLKTMKKAFRSENIHIGMDEATSVGLGQYYKDHRNDVINQNELIFDHLAKVCALCDKYGYKPMIWSDLFFPDHNNSQIYTYNSYMPEEYKSRVPNNIRFMYWYYSGRNKNRYLTLLKRHKETGNPIAFGGAGWNWEGFAPNHKIAFEFMIPALDACIEENPELVLNTLWGNGGCETSFFLCFPSNALFAEYHWSGADADIDYVWEFNEFVTKTPKKVYDNIDVLNFGLYDNIILGRKLLRQDVLETVRIGEGFLLENLPDVFHNGEPMAAYRKAADELENYVKTYGDWNEYLSLEAAVLRTAAYKAELHTYMRAAYKDGNKVELERICNEVLPECRESYKKMYKLFHQQWRREYKAFGWESHCQICGCQIARIDYAIEMLSDYLNGEIDLIEELEAEPLCQNISESDKTMDD